MNDEWKCCEEEPPKAHRKILIRNKLYKCTIGFFYLDLDKENLKTYSMWQNATVILDPKSINCSEWKYVEKL